MNQFKKQNIENLKATIDELKSKLIEVIDKWYYYQNDVYQEIMFRYDNIFGDLEDEIDTKIQTASELEKKVELIKMKIRSGSQINHNTVKFISSIASRQTSRTALFAPKPNNNEPKYGNRDKSLNNVALKCEVNDNYELPQLYRNLVKKLHPDVAGESKEFVRFWDNVQQAYRSKDIDSLRLLNLTICADTEENVDNRNAEIALKTKIYELEQSIRKQEARLRNLQFQEPFSFEKKLDDRFWVARRKNQLNAKLIQIDRKIQHHNKLLSSLVDNKNFANREKFSNSQAV